MNQARDKLNFKIFTFAFILILLVNFYIFQGMFHSLAFASIAAGIFFPLYNKCKTRFKLSNEMAALFVTALIVVIIVLPLIFVIFQVSKETVGLYGDIRGDLSLNKIKDFFFGDGVIGRLISSLSEKLGIEVDLMNLYTKTLSKLQSYSGKVFATLNSWLSDTFSFIFQFVLMILGIFTIFVEGEKLKDFIFKLSPLPDEQEQLILEKFSQMNYVTLVCNGVGGVIQGILAGIGFWIAGLQSIFLWSVIMVILAFIPLLGISIITIPACIYLYFKGKALAATLLLIYTAAIAFLAENYYKPKFMGKKIKINSLLILFYIFAGMSTFGMAGIFYGPIICTIFLTMVEIFQVYYLPKIETFHS